MEHLILDPRVQGPPEQVPMLGLVEYDNVELWTFPWRCGYSNVGLKQTAVPELKERWATESQAKAITGSKRSKLFMIGQSVVSRFSDSFERVAESIVPLRGERDGGDRWHALSVIQEWLFFGLLLEFGKIVDHPVYREDFIRVTAEGCFISTEKVPDLIVPVVRRILRSVNCDGEDDVETPLIDQIKNYQSTVSEEEKQRYVPRLEKIIRRASIYLYNCLGAERTAYESFAIPDEVTGTLEIAFAVVETLDQVTQHLFGTSSVMNAPTIPDMWLERGRANGLCPNKLFRNQSLLTSVTAQYLHTSIFSNHTRSHELCTKGECKEHWDLNRLPYHCANCDGDCEHVWLDATGQERMRDALTNDSYPLCVITCSNDGDLGLELIDSSWLMDGHSYVAISHVW